MALFRRVHQSAGRLQRYLLKSPARGRKGSVSTEGVTLATYNVRIPTPPVQRPEARSRCLNHRHNQGALGGNRTSIFSGKGGKTDSRGL
jgi:hypothetical protein